MSRSRFSVDRFARVKVAVVSLVAGMVVTTVATGARVAEPASATGRPFPLPQQEDVVVPDVPCRRQVWPNMDRHCLSWTAPAGSSRGGIGRDNTITRLPESASVQRQIDLDTHTAPPQPEDNGLSHLTVAALLPTAEFRPLEKQTRMTPVSKTPERKPRLARHSNSKVAARHVSDDLTDIPMSSFARRDTPHRSVIRRTRYRDHYYYSSRPVTGRGAAAALGSFKPEFF